MSEEFAARLLRRVERERTARKEAERLLEERALALYQANLRLKESALALEAEVQSRTYDLQQALKTAEIATRAKSEFLAVMSHEIRTPLNGILGTCELLALSDLKDDQKALLDTIARCGDSLLVVINDILDFSKIEAGHLVLDPVPTSVRAELDSVMQLYRPLAETKGIGLSMSCSPDLPHTLMVDQTRLRQVVGNLTTNAIKFTQTGAVRLDVWGALEKAGALETSLAPGGTAPLFRLHVAVHDSGIGIAPEALAHLFQPFSQADSSTTRRFGGTGLGLVICERLIKAMGGQITVQSELGRGSCFTFFIRLEPVQRISGPQVGSTLVEHEKQARERLFTEWLNGPAPSRVLLVEDNPVNQALALKLLQKMGLTVDLAHDGVEALEQVSARSASDAYALILMDMQMPRMDGLEATRRIRALDLPCPPVIIALTANAFESDKQRCLAIGMNGFLPKPFRFEQLKTAVMEAVLGRTGSP